MKKQTRFLSIILILILALSLVSCGDKKEEAVENEVVEANENEATQEVAEEKDEKESFESEKTDFGLMTKVHQDNDVDIHVESGPFKIDITDIAIAKLEVEESSRAMFDDKDEVTLVLINVKAENTSDESMNIYPDQGTITTNTKEQKDAHLFLSEDVGGEFIGNIIEEGTVMFVLDSNADEITDIKYIIGAPSDSSFNSVGEEIVIEYNVK